MKRITRRSFSMAASGSLLSPLISNLQGATRIPRRPFGETGIDVPIVGLGGGGRFFEAVSSDEAGGELVRQVIDHGIEYIETAANYGPAGDPNRSERRIGLAMKTHRAKVFLETKIDARDYDGAMREIENSLKQFQTDHIDFLLHHAFFRTEEVDRALAPNGAEKAIRRMIDQKAVRFRGFSCHSPELALQTIPRIEPDGVQFPINATRVPDFEAEVLPFCKSRGIAGERDEDLRPWLLYQSRTHARLRFQRSHRHTSRAAPFCPARGSIRANQPSDPHGFHAVRAVAAADDRGSRHRIHGNIAERTAGRGRV